MLIGIVSATVCMLPPMSRRSILTALPAAAIAPSVAEAMLPVRNLPLPSTATMAAASAPSAAAEFYSGLLAGAVQKTVKELALHPLDTAKARLQVEPSRLLPRCNRSTWFRPPRGPQSYLKRCSGNGLRHTCA